ncbi:MAG: type-F conjugative transfer system pilin assembly protein TrbC [Holosporales bacterium]
MLCFIGILFALGIIPASASEVSQIESLASSTAMKETLQNIMHEVVKHKLSDKEQSQLKGDANQVLAEAHKHRGEVCPESKHVDSPEPSRSSIYICVSLSMPLHVIRTLGEDVSKVGGTLIFRGLKGNSFKKMIAALMPIMKDGVLPIALDPDIFQKHHVTKVPTFIHLDQSGKATQLSGNVNLSFALEKIAAALGPNSEVNALLLHLKGGR